MMTNYLKKAFNRKIKMKINKPKKELEQNQINAELKKKMSN